MRSPKLPILVFAALAFVVLAPQMSLAQYAINTVAGGGPNNLPAVSASIGYPGSIAFDSAGNAYIADSNSNHIFEVSVSTGIVTVVAGNGTAGYSGDGGPATAAALNNPEGVFADASGNIFIADTGNCLIREVSSGTISTVAGSTTLPCPGYSGDGGPATTAQLNDPYGVFADKTGNIFIADTSNAIIREVTIANGNIQTVAGTPGSPGYSGDGALATAAELGLPEGVFVDGSGNIFIADTDNSVIREVTVANAYIQTVAGSYYDFEVTDVCNYSGDTGPAIAAQLCLPAGVYVDSSENIYIADTLNSAIREVTASTGDIATVAGNGTAGYTGDGGLAISAQLNNPSNIVVDSSGDVFIADTDNSAIRELTASTGDIATTVGNKFLSYSGDGGPATNAELSTPSGVFVDGAGNFYIADSANSVIREVVATTGDIQTVAGNGIPGYSGDGSAATSAELDSPEGVFVDSAGNIFIADTNNSVIREVVASTGDIQTVAGNFLSGPGYSGDSGPATSAQLNGPFGVFVDSADNIFIADTSNSVIREVTASNGNIATVAGNGTECTQPATACGDGGAAISAQLSFPTSVFVDLSEDIFIADTLDFRIREVTASNSFINTLAGSGVRGYAGDGAAATSAQLDTPYGVFVDLSGDIFIADTGNAAIREVVAATGFIQTVAGTPPTPGFSGDNGQSTNAEINSPSGVFGNSTGNLFIADTDNQRIRELTPGIFVSVSPVSTNVAVTTQAQFTATVSAPTGDTTAVTWQVNNIVGGNSTIGTISTTGLFQAPSAIPIPATVTITAISQADNTTSGSAQATIVPTGDAVTVTVSTNPSVSQVYTTTTQVFIATVTGTNNTAVTWQVDGVTGGNATVGTIDASGNYTAPASVPSPATVTIEAVSQAVSSAIGSEQVLIVTNPSAAQPAPQTIAPGGSATYSLLLNENVGWTGGAVTLSCKSSTLPPSATCSFSSQAGAPITTITPGAQAVPFTLTINVPSGSAALVKPDGMRPQIYFAFVAFVPLAGILLAGIGRRTGRQNERRNKQQGWLWLAGLCVVLVLLNACGGGGSGSTQTNPELGTYNVKVLGTTSAQPNPVTITTAGLTVAQ